MKKDKNEGEWKGWIGGKGAEVSTVRFADCIHRLGNRRPYNNGRFAMADDRRDPVCGWSMTQWLKGQRVTSSKRAYDEARLGSIWTTPAVREKMKQNRFLTGRRLPSPVPCHLSVYGVGQKTGQFF